MWTRIGGGQADVYGSGKEYVGGGGIWQERCRWCGDGVTTC